MTRFLPRMEGNASRSIEPRREVDMIRSNKMRMLFVLLPLAIAVGVLAGGHRLAVAQPPGETATEAHHSGGEAGLVLPDLGQATFFGGTNGRSILMVGILVSILGLGFGLMIYTQLKNLPVHESMREISELIYETCKTYLTQQGKFLMILELFIGSIIFLYFFFLQHMPFARVLIILFFSLVGIAGSYG